MCSYGAVGVKAEMSVFKMIASGVCLVLLLCCAIWLYLALPTRVCSYSLVLHSVPSGRISVAVFALYFDFVTFWPLCTDTLSVEIG